ncbi:hypothetical protein AVEN_84555-1 [Araneus ventricosus]|uniref:Tesmin/TSO1-like CXC domain-containing protein n=1 Tax=Araneus ventricosus TaxID=182803 RepID=A0A4Y2L574_ARAVE|nr:hypothetical protein AVEN_84555-1 [Araneus ventricosus]
MFVLHASCRKKYTRPQSITRDLKIDVNSLFYRSTTGCGGRCGCRKSGIQCSSGCGTCHGICTNGAPLEEEEFEHDRVVEESNEI